MIRKKCNDNSLLYGIYGSYDMIFIIIFHMTLLDRRIHIKFLLQLFTN